MKCRHCNKDLDENMICCPYCGTPVENAAQQPHDNPAHAEQPNGAVPNQPAAVVQRKSNAFGITGFVVSLCFSCQLYQGPAFYLRLYRLSSQQLGLS